MTWRLAPGADYRIPPTPLREGRQQPHPDPSLPHTSTHTHTHTNNAHPVRRGGKHRHEKPSPPRLAVIVCLGIHYLHPTHTHHSLSSVPGRLRKPLTCGLLYTLCAHSSTRCLSKSLIIDRPPGRLAACSLQRCRTHMTHMTGEVSPLAAQDPSTPRIGAVPVCSTAKATTPAPG
jgi:hypothetical protein